MQEARRIKSQSTIEYVVLLTFLILCILWGASTLFKPALEQGLGNAKGAIEKVSSDAASQF